MTEQESPVGCIALITDKGGRVWTVADCFIGKEDYRDVEAKARARERFMRSFVPGEIADQMPSYVTEKIWDAARDAGFEMKTHWIGEPKND